jgi:23S rRNA (uracil1939-C5)-methyltransferase
VGAPLTLTIEKLVHGGRGLARREGTPVFVGGALAGERVEAVVTAVRKGYLEAALARVVAPSPDRIEAPCPLVATCGGCQIQHLAYRAQLEAKRAIAVESLRRLGGLAADVPPVTPSPEVFGYRVRADLKIGAAGEKRVLGFHAARSRTVVPVPACPVLHSRLQAALGPLSDLVARGNRGLAGLDEVEIQTTGAGPDLVIVFRMRALDRRALGAIGRELRGALPLRGLVAYDHRHHRWVGGDDALEERIDGIDCRVSDRTFLQINPGVNAALVSAVVEWAELSGRERVVDLYAGFGNFSLPLARLARLVTAVESSPSAVADARFNARVSGVGLRVASSPVESWTPEADEGSPDLVVVDPPRAGLTQAALDRAVALAAPRILYVSCEPATLARDAGRFARAGYRLARVRGFDMFPHTAHVEILSEFIGPPRSVAD